MAAKIFKGKATMAWAKQLLHPLHCPGAVLIIHKYHVHRLEMLDQRIHLSIKIGPPLQLQGLMPLAPVLNTPRAAASVDVSIQTQKSVNDPSNASERCHTEGLA